MCTSIFTFTVFSLLGCSNIFLIILPIITLAFSLIHFQYHRKMTFVKENMIVSSSCLAYVKVLKKKQTNKLFSPLLTAWLTLAFRSQIACGKPFRAPSSSSLPHIPKVGCFLHWWLLSQWLLLAHRLSSSLDFMLREGKEGTVWSCLLLCFQPLRQCVVLNKYVLIWSIQL